MRAPLPPPLPETTRLPLQPLRPEQAVRLRPPTAGAILRPEIAALARALAERGLVAEPGQLERLLSPTGLGTGGTR